jgi:hypothetical protein
VPLEPESLEPAARHRLRLLGVGVEDLEAEQHVGERRAPRHQAVALEHDADLAAKELEVAKRIVPAHGDLAGGGLDQPGDQIEHGGFAAAGLAEHRDDLARRDLERQPVHCQQVATAVGAAEHLAHVAKADERLTHLDAAQIARSETAR